MNGKRAYGDYQTPYEFTEKVCTFLKNNKKLNPSAIVEPTCGIGNFLKSSLVFNAKEYYGIEINPIYCDTCNEKINNDNVKIVNADFFSISSLSLIGDKSQVLVIGNPPWVTNSTLSTLSSNNLPKKKNFKKLTGIDAITGASNFDICEFIILKLIYEYINTDTVIAMLCKTSVVRNIFVELKKNNIAFKSCDMFEFDAYKVFGINANACLLLIYLSDKIDDSADKCNVYDFDNPDTIKFQIEYCNEKLYSNINSSAKVFDGQCCFEWRQGVKHDCSKIMELSLKNNELINGKNEVVHIEKNLVYPLVKSSMFKSPIINDFSKYVIITQKKVRQDTKYIKSKFPKTWNYLNSYVDCFDKRKSTIYKNSPAFSMFGIGEYSFSSYKVGLSGFYKKPLFSLLYSYDGKPVMMDDTCYFISFSSFDMAYVAMLLLNSPKVQEFLINVAFLDSKRPYTKKILKRIDFKKITDYTNINDMFKVETTLNISHYITEPMFNEFKSMVQDNQLRV